MAALLTSAELAAVRERTELESGYVQKYYCELEARENVDM